MTEATQRIPKVGDKVLIYVWKDYLEGEILATASDYMGRLDMAKVGYRIPIMGWETYRWVEVHRIYYP